MVPISNLLRKQGADVRQFTESRVRGAFFLLPKWARAGFEKGVRTKLARLLADHRDCELVLFAHSYGSYLLTETLRENTQLQITRAVLYGSVVRRDFDWYHVADCFSVKRTTDEFPVLNCCGNRDFWPVAAECMSTDYGSSGSHGFMNGKIRDFYSEGDHSSFLRTIFARQTWLPYIMTGNFPDADSATPLDHHDVANWCRIPAFFWVTCFLRHVAGMLYLLRHFIAVVVAICSLLFIARLLT